MLYHIILYPFTALYPLAITIARIHSHPIESRFAISTAGRAARADGLDLDALVLEMQCDGREMSQAGGIVGVLRVRVHSRLCILIA
jgi:hypothetical protein